LEESQVKKFNITVNGTSYAVEVEEAGGAVSAPKAAAPKAAAPAPAPAAPAPAPAAAPAAPAAKAAAGETEITAPMPGKILKVLAKPGDAVNSGTNLMMLEAMKMQNEILAGVDGTVKAINVSEGQTVKVGEVLAIVG
jgi:biotin carboxyl carrier protein